jgi:signal transduction histidine kinase
MSKVDILMFATFLMALGFIVSLIQSLKFRSRWQHEIAQRIEVLAGLKASNQKTDALEAEIESKTAAIENIRHRLAKDFHRIERLLETEMKPQCLDVRSFIKSQTKNTDLAKDELSYLNENLKNIDDKVRLIELIQWACRTNDLSALPAIEPFDIVEMLHYVIGIHQPSARKKDIDIRFIQSIHVNFIDSDISIAQFIVDQVLYYSVLYADPGSKLSIELHWFDYRFQISISNQCIGIQELHDKTHPLGVLELEIPGQEHEIYQLSMNICGRLINLLGGEIEVLSRKGIGLQTIIRFIDPKFIPLG